MKVPFQRKPPTSRWDDEDESMEPPEPLVMPAPVNPGFYDPSWDEWDEKDNKWGRRGVVALIVVAVLFAGVLALKPVLKKAFKASSATTTTTVKFDTKATVYEIPPGDGQAPSATFTGDKATTTPAFAAPDGLAIVTFDCACTSGFSITVNDATGTAAAIPVNVAQSGHQAGTAPMALTAGNYAADITGTGKWKITFSFPGNTGIVSLPFIKTLTGPEVVGPFSGSQPVTVTYGAFVAPNQNVVIHVMDMQGNMASEVLSTTASGVKTVKLPAQGAPYYLVAEKTPGTWFLRVLPDSGT
jgi:hypothetical protein